MLRYYKTLIMRSILELISIPILFFYAIKSRYSKKEIDIGFGPEPLINNVYHKKALSLYGYSAETFIIKPYFITDKFDIILDDYDNATYFQRLGVYFKLMKAPFKYKCLYFYFHGCALYGTKYLWRVEPFIYKLANIKTVIMPYGGDVQDMSRSQNLYFKHTLSQDYPLHKNSKNRIDDKIDLWTKYADHVISGCEWVDYMYHWDTLTLAHFSIELLDNTNTKYYTEGAFKVFHAPNHVQIKGTNHLKKAIKSLQKDGYNIELVMLRGVSNDKIIKTIQEVDLVADQFVVGWYAMFALEAMSLGKPVLCYLRDDLIDLYIKAELIEKDEIPIINTSVLNIKEQLIWCYENRGKLNNIGKNSRQYVQNHHSIEYIGKIFDNINSTLNIK